MKNWEEEYKKLLDTYHYTLKKLNKLKERLDKQGEPVAFIKQGADGKPTLVFNHQFSYQAECAKWHDVPLYLTPQTKPLSDEEIDNIIQKLNQSRVTWSGNQFIKESIRQAEERHGIK